MSTNYKTYVRTTEVRAYEVKEAHNVVTRAGLVAVQPGSFVGDDGTIYSADDFDGFKVKGTRKRAPAKKAAPKSDPKARTAAAKARAGAK